MVAYLWPYFSTKKIKIMGEFNTCIAALAYQKVIDNSGKFNGNNPDAQPFGLSIKEFHVLTLIAAEYKSIPELYKALKYLRLFLSYASIFTYVKRLESKGFISLIYGHGKAYNGIFATPTLTGYTTMQSIEAELLEVFKRKFAPVGNPGKVWNQKALPHLRFNANGYETDKKGAIAGNNYPKSKGGKYKQQPNDQTS